MNRDHRETEVIILASLLEIQSQSKNPAEFIDEITKRSKKLKSIYRKVKPHFHISTTVAENATFGVEDVVE